ncbi:hypothetical protein ACS7SF_00965 [Ralstonia sp. 25C]|uniref:hypothetical protein n=1 Tax=Ralstonia sp. 25C TaxID=3447363 RepID=UPI003F7554CF
MPSALLSFAGRFFFESVAGAIISEKRAKISVCATAATLFEKNTCICGMKIGAANIAVAL